MGNVLTHAASSLEINVATVAGCRFHIPMATSADAATATHADISQSLLVIFERSVGLGAVRLAVDFFDGAFDRRFA